MNYVRVRDRSPGFGGYDFDSPNLVGSVSRGSSPLYGAGGPRPILPEEGVISSEGASSLGSAPAFNQEVEQQQARQAMGIKTEKKGVKLIDEANRARARDLAKARRTGNFINTAASIAKAFIPVPGIS